MEKVILPREVAESLVRLKERNYTWTPHDLFHVIMNKGYITAVENVVDVDIIRKWAFTNELTFAKAILNSYEVEQTPEDKVRKYCINTLSIVNGTEIRAGIIDVLNMLNIKIEGVNA